MNLPGQTYLDRQCIGRTYLDRQCIGRAFAAVSRLPDLTFQVQADG
jgi:hypothetical protein